jgi:hypothetical protein
MNEDAQHLLLTTFPTEVSANVGDALITDSFIAILRHAGLPTNFQTFFREIPLDPALREKFGKLPIFLPGMSMSVDFFPKLYSLCNHADLPKGLIPFGCTWQHPFGLDENAERVIYPEEPRRILEAIVNSTGPIAVRDHLAARILRRNNIPSIVVGDCAWFHLPSIGKPMRRVGEPQKIVITTPHNQALTHQSISLIDSVRRRFPHAKIVVSLHSRRRKLDYIIAAHAKEHEIEVIDAAGELNIFDRYASYDLHVGHRLHGHIGFLRQRIPSVLVMEDARSRGFSRSIPIGCFSAFRSVVGNNIAAQLPRAVVAEQMHPDPEVISRISEFLDEEISTSFLRYVGVAPYIDGVFCEVTLPELKRKVKLAREAIDLMPR